MQDGNDMKNTAPLFIFLYALLLYQAALPQTPRCAAAAQEAPARPAETELPAPAGSDSPEADRKGRDSALRGESSFLGRIPVRPMETALSPSAQDLFIYLLFTQAMLDENENDLLAAASLLSGPLIPAKTWMEGGVWLLGRKSKNAIPYLERALGIYPDDMSINLLYAEALLESGRADDGVRVMRDFLKKFPNSIDARLELALLLVKTRQFAEAERLLKNIGQKQRTPLVEYYHARALIGMNRNAEAIPYLQKAVRGLPDFVEALTELAYIYEQNGNWKEARNVYERLNRLNFSPREVALRLVNLSLKMKQPEKALQYIRKGPDSQGFLLAAAGMLIDARHFLQAENILKRLAAGDNAPPEAYLLLADVAYEQKKDLGLALSWLDRLPPTGKNALKGILLRAQLLAESGKDAEALEILRAEKKKYPDMPEIQEFEIRLLARKKELPKATELARESAARWPDNPDVLFLLGSVLDEGGDKGGALKVMEKILAIQPDNYQALNYVGYTLAEENRDIPRAISLLTRADEISPNQSFIIDSLAWALFRANRIQESLQQIRRAVNLAEQQDPAIWEHYGDIAKAAGKRDEARRAYRKALDLRPENAKAIREKASKL